MKKQLAVTTVVGLMLMNAAAFAGVTYGPVITVKPKGYQAEQGAPAAGKPSAPNSVKSNQKAKPTGLILPAVQNQHDTPKPSAPGSVKSNQKTKPAALLLPAVQKARQASPGTNVGTKKKTDGEDDGTAIQGALDRDIIRRIPKGPAPKPK